MSLSVLFFWLVAMLLIIVLNALFVAAEFSLVASRKSRIQELAEDGNTQAVIVLKLQQQMETSVSGTQLGITLASLGLGWVADDSMHQLMTMILNHIPFVSGIEIPASLGFLIPFLMLSSLHVVLGEQVPKFLALRVPENTALWIARPFHLYCRIAYPFIFVLQKTAMFILKLMGIPMKAHHHSALSMEEFEILFEASRKAGELDDTQTDILKSALDLKHLSAEQAMVPTKQMDCISVSANLAQVLAVVSKTKHSKLPVFRDNIHNIVGVLNCRDLFDFWQANAPANSGLPAKSTPFELSRLLRPAFTALTTMSASDLLDELRERKIQMAIIKDTSGKTVGLATMEDLLEHLVGEIYDEYDKVELSELPRIPR